MSSKGFITGPLRIVEGKTFNNEDVVLDDCSHKRCVFNKCRLVYRGRDARLFECAFSPDCTWSLEQSAALTIQVLREARWRIIPPYGGWLIASVERCGQLGSADIGGF